LLSAWWSIVCLAISSGDSRTRSLTSTFTPSSLGRFEKTCFSPASPPRRWYSARSSFISRRSTDTCGDSFDMLRTLCARSTTMGWFSE